MRQFIATIESNGESCEMLINAEDEASAEAYLSSKYENGDGAYIELSNDIAYKPGMPEITVPGTRTGAW